METAAATMDEVGELKLLCGDVTEFQEGGKRLLLLARLTLPAGCVPAEVEALLCPQERDGYQTRLFLSQLIAGRGSNWSVHRLMDRNWHTWSWQGISPNQRLAQILRGHLRGLQ